MGWLSGQDLRRSSGTSVLVHRNQIEATLSGRHASLFWSRLCGPAGLPYNPSGQLVHGAWVDRLKELNPGCLILSGLMQDEPVFGGIGQTIAAVSDLVRLLGLTPDRCVLCPHPVWCEEGDTTARWSQWVSHARQSGFHRWLLEAAPFNRLWWSGNPVSRFEQVQDYVDWISTVSSLITNSDPDAVCIAPVSWQASSSWGANLVQQLAGVNSIHEIAVTGICPVGRNFTDVKRACFAEVRRVVAGILAVRSVSPQKVKHVIPVSSLTPPAGSGYAYGMQEPRGTAPFGTAIRTVLAGYLMETGYFDLIAWWLQPALPESWPGVRLCDNHGNLTSAGWALQQISQMRTPVLLQEGVARYLDAEDSELVKRSGPAGACIFCLSGSDLRFLHAHLAEQDTVEYRWSGVSAVSADVSLIENLSRLSESAQSTEEARGLVSSDGYVWRQEHASGSILAGRISILPIRLGADARLSPSTQPDRDSSVFSRSDGIGDLDDLLVSTELLHPSLANAKPTVSVNVHSGVFYLSGTERRLYVEPRLLPVDLISGIQRVSLPSDYPPGWGQPPSLVDSRGSFQLICAPVRLGRRLTGSEETLSGSVVWKYRIPGSLLDVRSEDDLQTLYPVSRIEDLSESSYHYDEIARVVYCLRSDVLFDYIADNPQLWIEEVVWNDGVRGILSRRLPYVPSATATQVGTGRVYAPDAVVDGRWRFHREPPPGEYLLRYLVDRSFTLDDGDLLVFTGQPSSAQLIYSCADSLWHRTAIRRIVPEEIAGLNFVYQTEGQPDPSGYIAQLFVVMPETVAAGFPYHVRVEARTKGGTLVPFAPLRLHTLQAGGAEISPVSTSGKWETNQHGFLLLRVSPGQMESRYRLEAVGSSAFAVMVIPPTDYPVGGGYVEHVRLTSQQDDGSDWLLLRVHPTGGWSSYTMRVQAIGGWVALPAMTDQRQAPVRRDEVALEIPMQHQYGSTVFTTVGWSPLIIPKSPIRLRVSLISGSGQVEEYYVEVP